MSPIHASRVAPLSTMPEVLDDVLRGNINPDRIFDFETTLEGIVEAYEAMNERRAIKALIRMTAA